MTPGWFHPPFREGWYYEGATYAGHSDYSVDWNRRTAEGAWLEDRGDPVLAAAAGLVAAVDKHDGAVLLDHEGGLWRTEYRHMTDIVVKEGEHVQRGDRIGSIGSVVGDGASTGPHLHHVHWRRPRTSAPFVRTTMRFLGVPVRTSVRSAARPASWTPPKPQMVVGGPLPRPPVPLPDRPRYQDGFRAMLEAAGTAVAAVPVPGQGNGPVWEAGAVAGRSEALQAIRRVEPV